MKKIEELLKELYPEVADEFDDSDDFISDGLLDSIDIQRLFDAVEEEYGITLKGSELMPQNFKSVVSIRELLEDHDITGV